MSRIDFFTEQVGSWTEVVAVVNKEKIFLGRYQNVGGSQYLVEYQEFKNAVVLCSLMEVKEYLWSRYLYEGGYLGDV